MKSKLAKLAQVATLGFALAFTFSCTSDGNDDDGGGLTLSGQVYTSELDYKTMNYKFVPYTGPNKTFKSNTKGTGSIIGGKMSFSTGIPSNDILEPAFESDTDDDEFGIYSDAKVEPSDALGISLDFSGIDLAKENTNIVSVDMNTGFIAIETEAVIYNYVDRDCTIAATGGTYIDEEDGIEYTYQNLNLKLKKGWNTINMKATAIKSATGIASTMTMNTGDLSSSKWVLGDYEEYEYSSKNLSQLAKMAKLGIQQSINANK